MSIFRNKHIIRWGSYVLIGILLLVWFTPQNPANVHAKAPESIPIEIGSLCGKLVFLTEEGTGATRLGLRPCVDSSTTYVFSQNPADLFNVYQFKNVTVESGDPFKSVEHGKLTKYITGWDGYFQIASCADCNKGIAVQPTPTITFTPEPTLTETEEAPVADTPEPPPANASFVITNFQADPGNPVLNQRFTLRITVENSGDPLDGEPWDYSGEVVLKDNQGNQVESYSFSRDDASYINQAIENGQTIPNKWVITVPVSFGTEVDDGRLSVAIQPQEYPISPEKVEAKVTLKAAAENIQSCALKVAEQIGAPFADNPTLKAAWDGEVANVVTKSCAADDVGCYTEPLIQGLVNTLLQLAPDLRENTWTTNASLMNKLLLGLSGIFDTGTLQVCQQPVDWLWESVSELNKRGVAINFLGIASPATMMITNVQNETSGVGASGAIVSQIPNAQVFQWSHETFILYPPQEVLIVLDGTGDGLLTLDGILGKDGDRVILSFENVQFQKGIRAVVNTAASMENMEIDSNADGQTDSTQQANRVETIPQELTQIEPIPTEAKGPTIKLPYNFPCCSSPALALPLAGFWLWRRKKTKIG